MHKGLRNRVLVFIALGLAFCLGAYLIFGSNGLLHVHFLKQQKADLDDKVHALRQENARLTEQLRRLQTDQEYLEQVIRDKLGLVKSDEALILFKALPENGSGYQ